MEKMFLWAIVTTFAITSCSKPEGDYQSLYNTSYTLYHSQTKNIQGDKLSKYKWESDNEFVVTVSNGVITGQFVGKTQVRNSAHKLYFDAAVRPKYNLYNEPNLDFGTSMSSIRYEYGTPYKSDSQVLIYESSNKYAPYYMYMFDEHRKLIYSSVVVTLSAGNSLVDFLSERYLTLSVDISTHTATYAHCYGKKADPKFDYSVGFQYSSSVGGLIVVYAPNSTSNSTTSSTSDSTYNLTIGTNNDTRTNIDVSKCIEEILVRNNIKVE